jgi:hypothetical protein
VAESKPNPSPFIDKSTAYEAYTESLRWFTPYFQPIDELERIARNRPSDRIGKELPRITDGTMAAIVQEQPKRIIQQVATGKVECESYPIHATIADITHRKIIIPSYCRMGDALQKQWNMLGKSMTYGRSTSYTFFTETNGNLHVDFIIPYVKDVLTEKGKVFAPDSNISFMRAWYQKRDITAIINREKWLEDHIKGYKTPWDLEALASFAEAGSSAKPADLQTAAEKEKGGDAGGYEMIHAFQKGIGAEFYSFAPRHKDGQALRSKVNKDPRGFIPLDHLYCNIDLSNPLGRGQVELSGGIQNLIDQQMQMFQFMSTLEMGPPLQVYGKVKKNTIKFRPNAIWDMGTDPTNKVIPYEVNNQAMANFPNNYGLLKSQIFNLNSSQDHSISAESGNVAQSKTQAGVNAAEARLGVSDNYLRKQFEAWFGCQSETAVNVQFAEITQDDKVTLTADELEEIVKMPGIDKYLDGKTLTIPYKEVKDYVFKFYTDASSSEVKEDAENKDKLIEIYGMMQTDPDPEVQAARKKVLKLAIDEIGAEGTDGLFPSLDKTEAGQQQMQMTMQNMMPQIQQMVQQMIEQSQAQKPQPDPMIELIKALGIKLADFPETGRQKVFDILGAGAGEQSPADHQQTLEIFKALGEAHNQLASQDQARQQAQQQSAAQPATNEPSANTNGPATNTNAGSAASDGTQQPPALTDALTPDEQHLAVELTHRGFNEQDIEQAIVMLRQHTPLDRIIQILGSKYAAANR